MKLTAVVGAVGVSGLLSAFGYAALRAHWNHIGVSVHGGVTAERYIAETWSIVASSIPLVLLTTVVLLIAWGIAAAIGRLIARWWPAAPARLAPFVPVLLIAGLLAAEVAALRIISPESACTTDLFLGDLAAKEKAGCFERPPAAATFVAMLAMVVITLAATRGETLSRLQLVARIVAVAVALHLPVVYGNALEPAQYRIARVAFGGKTADGVILLQTAGYIQLWDVVGGRGRMRILPGGAVIESGPALDLFQLAHDVATSGDPAAFQRTCNANLTPGGP